MPVQHAMAILRFCAIPRMNYLTRVIRPDLLRPACEYFDKETALTKLGLPSIVTNEAHSLLTQPIRLGGFGLRRMVSVSPAAYWSSFCQAAPDIAALIQSRCLVAPSSDMVAPPPPLSVPQSISDVPVVQSADPAPAPAPASSIASTSFFTSLLGGGIGSSLFSGCNLLLCGIAGGWCEGICGCLS